MFDYAGTSTYYIFILSRKFPDFEEKIKLSCKYSYSVSGTILIK